MDKMTIDQFLISVRIYKFPRFYKQYEYYEREERLEQAYIFLCILNEELAKNILYMNDHKGHLTVAAHYFKDDAKQHIERAWELCGECDDNTSFYSIGIETR